MEHDADDQFWEEMNDKDIREIYSPNQDQLTAFTRRWCARCAHSFNFSGDNCWTWHWEDRRSLIGDYDPETAEGLEATGCWRICPIDGPVCTRFVLADGQTPPPCNRTHDLFEGPQESGSR